MYVLATLDRLRQRLGLSASDTADDARLLAALQAASAQIEAAAGRRFSPRVATIAHDVHPRHASELLLRDDLLRLDAISNGDGSSIDPLDVMTLPEALPDGPISVLRLRGGRIFTWETTPLRAVLVSGIWGWHDRWSRAWRDSADTVQDNPLTSSASTLTVNDADGADGYAVSPRFQVGHLLRIEEEYLRVLAVQADTNTLTVLRGVNGTTAAAHDPGTAIEVFQPALDVEMLCLRWALWLYKEPDSRAFASTPAALTAAIGSLRRVG
ncbi:MAG TPA: hypothetical protein VKY59_01255 [Spirillospora sp.]|nr:hypothetical protein [Spirillospora sp.]